MDKLFYMRNAIDQLRRKRPLIHCITNYVTVNDCANILLAAGALPIMADSMDEVDEIVAKSDGLCINQGTLNRSTLPVMHRAVQVAGHRGCPIVLDPVGAGASKFRTDTALELIRTGLVTLVRGNMSELKALAGQASTPRGTDVAEADRISSERLGEGIRFVVRQAQLWKCMVAVSGPVDLIADRNGNSCCVYNGHEIMPQVTGTGCMLSSLSAAFMAAMPDRTYHATVAAFCTMGLCGEKGANALLPGEGPAMWRIRFLDAVANLTGLELESGADFSLQEDK